jgi:early endosome antigen 1
MLIPFHFPRAAMAIKLNEAETETFNIKQMKDLFEQKAAQLATDIVG